MSKHRPSKNSAQYWLGRVFKNSYTRNGRVFELSNWSVKIQHAGRRRAVSLASPSRHEAAMEAKAIYHSILTQGWEAALPGRKLPAVAVQAPSKLNGDFWKDRLLRRRYQFPIPGQSEPTLTARIDHAGRGHFFPTSAVGVEEAANRAQLIYESVVAQGWETACQRFSRELTVGFEWCAQPVMWTYTTIQTINGKAETDPRSSRPPKSYAARVLLMETDRGTRRSLRWCLEEGGGTRVFECERADDFAPAIAHHKPQIIIVNRSFAGRPAALPRHVLALAYSVARDGDELFASTPGGSEGYIFKRIPPTRLLEPIHTAEGHPDPAIETCQGRIRSYFRDLFLPAAASEAARLGKLTRREHDVLGLLSKGHMDKEIAEALRISAWTVHDHIKSIFDRLRVRTRTEAVARYLEK